MNKNSKELNEIKKLLIIVLVVGVFSAGLYFITDNFLTKKDLEVKDVDIDYSQTLIGNVFNLPKEEYYVLAYDKKDEVYDDIYKEYISEDDSRYVYVVDLSLGFNKHVLSDESNTKPKDETEIKIKEVALMKFKDGKLIKYLDTEKDIRDELK